MIYRQFGKTGIELSAVGYGTNRLSYSDLQDVSGLNRAAELIVTAVNQFGINYIDCAHTYATGKAEEIVRLALPRLSRQCHLCVKVMYHEDPDENSAYKRINESLEHYGVSSVTFGFLWEILSYENFIETIQKGKTYDALRKAKEQNLIRHICVSLHTSPADSIKILQSGLFDGCIILY